MPPLRSRRLETLFGGPIDETLTFGQVAGLVPNAGEGPDLDFKQETYVTSGNGGQKGTKDLCGDVAAMANAAGGVIVLGMEEDDHARAKGHLPVDTSDDERRRLRQTVYGNVLPAPTFDIIPVEDPANHGHGFLVIWIARSAGAPHAFSPQGTGRHYPRRVGTEKVWLSEAEIAEAYRARFAGLTDRLSQADKIETEFLKRLSPDQVFVVVTLVPDLPGMFTINNEALRAFGTTYAHKSVVAMGIPMSSISSTQVRYRRLVASGSSHAHLPHSYVACELHQDGSGAFASSSTRRWWTPYVSTRRGWLTTTTWCSGSLRLCACSAPTHGTGRLPAASPTFAPRSGPPVRTSPSRSSATSACATSGLALRSSTNSHRLTPSPTSTTWPPKAAGRWRRPTGSRAVSTRRSASQKPRSSRLTGICVSATGIRQPGKH
jgi:hypothetical protein